MSDDEEEQGPAPALVAVDFTATRLRLVLTTPEREVIANESYDLPPLEDEEAWSWEVGGRISTLFARDEPLFALGIGISCPGPVHPVRGVLTESRGQDGWDELHVVDALRRHIDAPAVALDRTHAALRGEMSLGAAIEVTDVIYISFREPTPTAATLAAGTVIRGAHHRPGMIDENSAVTSIATAAALLDTALVVLDAPEEQAEQLATALHEALGAASADAEVIISELGASAPLFGALDAAAIVSYEGERDE